MVDALGTDSRPLYDALAPEFSGNFYEAPHRKAYDLLAWECIRPVLPASPGFVIDAGCGAGRWVERLLGLGHQVLGIEQSSGMAAVLKNRQFGPSFSLLEESMEAASIPSGRADAVLAIGSLQYTRNPEEMVRRFAGWLKPGGLLCVLADSLVGLVTELLHAHKIDEAHERLRTRTAVWQQHGLEAKLHLFDRRTIEGFFAAAEFVHVSTAGMLITASAWGRDECTQAARTDLDGLLKIERRFLCDPAMADSGKHLLTIGRRP